jgi:hypothetical protein
MGMGGQNHAPAAWPPIERPSTHLQEVYQVFWHKFERDVLQIEI